MVLNYEIINKNLLKLEEASKEFPIISEFKKLKSDDKNREKISSTAESLGLRDYIQFIKWIEMIEGQGMKIIYDKVDFNELKSILADKAQDIKFKEYIKTKNRKGFLTFLRQDFFVFNEGYKGSGRRGRGYGSNFKYTETILINFIILNQYDFDVNKVYNNFGKYFVKELPNYEVSANKELEITNEIAKSVIRKLNRIEYDFRRLNFNILKSQIESMVKQRMLTVEEDEQLRCLESHTDLTLNKVYNVTSYNISSNGSLIVYVINDSGVNKSYNYRLFENVSKLRDDKLENILAIFE
jgi:hypothetical protein